MKTRFPEDFDAECPWCGSQARHRLVWQFFKEDMNIFQGDKKLNILHIAPEGCFRNRIKKHYHENYITADLLAKNVDVKMDITDIQYADKSFDLIYCSHVLEHVVDDRKAISEFYRVLKPGAKAIILVPVAPNLEKTDEDFTVTDPQERLRRFGQEDHVRTYGKDVVQRLEEPGFRVRQIRPSDILSDEEISYTGILKGSGDIFECQR
ncbi:MAG: methyltransferase domain-containing protein [Moorea sp. SIO2I5]|nr:methyltransferase domain-containing protein [Moorena sp. SIO2I5]